MNNETMNNETHTIGNEAMVTFVSFGNKQLSGKVDTGATTSSLHAENIKVDQGNKVSFVCPEISNSVITMNLEGQQEVVSADAGGNQRPMIKMDVEIDGIPIRGASFNLNDRSEMDSPILIGQNILKVGNFVVDVNKNVDSEQQESQGEFTNNRDAKVLEAIQVLTEHNVTLSEIMQYIRTAAVNSIKE